MIGGDEEARARSVAQSGNRGLERVGFAKQERTHVLRADGVLLRGAEILKAHADEAHALRRKAAEIFRRGAGVDKGSEQDPVGICGGADALRSGAGRVDHAPSAQIGVLELGRGVAEVKALAHPGVALTGKQIVRMRALEGIRLVQIAKRIDALDARVVGIAFHAVGAENVDDDGHAARSGGSGREMVNGDLHGNTSGNGNYFSIRISSPAKL